MFIQIPNTPDANAARVLPSTSTATPTAAPAFCMELPTLAAVCIPAFWFAVFAPARMPAPLVKRLNADMNWVVQQPDVVLTHPYEGGHSDHDSTAFAVHLAAGILRRDGRPALARADLALPPRDGALLPPLRRLPDPGQGRPLGAAAAASRLRAGR